MAESEFLKQIEEYQKKIAARYDDNIAQSFYEVIEDLFEGMDEVEDDLDHEIWSECNIMDQMHSEKSVLIENKCEPFFHYLQSLITGKEQKMTSYKPPNLIDWACNDHQVAKAKTYMEDQCYTIGNAKNPSMYKLIHIGRNNHIPLLTNMVDLYQLAFADNIFSESDNRRDFRTHTDWLKLSPFFKKHKQFKLIERAMSEYQTRLYGSQVSTIMQSRLTDDINIYIEYVLLMSSVITNFLDSKKPYCPFQIDFIIFGQKNKSVKKKDENDDDKKDDDDSDDDDMMISSDNTFMGDCDESKVPDFTKLFTDNKVKFTKAIINLKSNKSTPMRTIQQLIADHLGDKVRSQRFCIIIDRTKSTDGNDDVYIYQLDKWDVIKENYCDESFGWQSVKAIIPDPNQGSSVQDRNFLGAGTDIGGNNFVMSYHVHNEDYVKIEQFIKGQRCTFTPYLINALWPKYFKNEFGIIKDKYNHESIMNAWKLPVNTRLRQWAKVVDPEMYDKIV